MSLLSLIALVQILIQRQQQLFQQETQIIWSTYTRWDTGSLCLSESLRIQSDTQDNRQKGGFQLLSAQTSPQSSQSPCLLPPLHPEGPHSTTTTSSFHQIHVILCFYNAVFHGTSLINTISFKSHKQNIGMHILFDPHQNSNIYMEEPQPQPRPISSTSTSIKPPRPSRYQKFKSRLNNVLSLADFFNAKASFNFEGSQTSSSMLGGVITVVVFVIAISISGNPFDNENVTFIDLMDDIVYNITAEKHPIWVNITLPPGTPPLYNNISVRFGCTSTMVNNFIGQYVADGVPCQLGDFCSPPELQCPIFTHLNKDQSSVQFTVNVCNVFSQPDCDLSFFDSLDYMNFTVSYYSDVISHNAPQFDRIVRSKTIYVPMNNVAMLDDTLELNYYSTNDYITGLFGFSEVSLVSLKYPQTYASRLELYEVFFGLDYGDSVFSYSQTISQQSRKYTHNFPDVNKYLAQVVSFFSVIMVLMNVLLSHYENNIFVLKLVNYLHYFVEPEGTITNISETSPKTILACLLFHDRLMRCYSQGILDYFKNHFDAMRMGMNRLMITSLFSDLKQLQNGYQEVMKEDIDIDLDSDEEVDKPAELQRKIREYKQANFNEWDMNSDTHMKVFMRWVLMQNCNFKQAVCMMEALFGKNRNLDTADCQFHRREYHRFRSSIFPDLPYEVYCINEEDVMERFEPLDDGPQDDDSLVYIQESN